MVQNAIEATGERRLKARDAVGKIDVNGDGRLSTVDLELLSTFVQFLLN